MPTTMTPENGEAAFSKFPNKINAFPHLRTE